MPESRRSRSEFDAARIEVAGGAAGLPGLDLKCVQQRAARKAAPPFNAFGRAPQTANPLAFSAPAARSAWRSWTWVEALPADACAGATDRQECIASAAQRGSGCSGAVRLSPP
jgi:hypothetical protein